MQMLGDNKSLPITSTRAITINASKNTVWQLLMQLGAKKQGFYSYDFLEENLKSKEKNADLKIGDIIHGSSKEDGRLSSYNFKVLDIDPKDAIVLENWGTFLLKSKNKDQTRLIIRTQEIKSTNLLTAFKNELIIPFHFIMERRMMLGIKMEAEQNKSPILSFNKDLLWLAGVVLSSFLILLIFIVLNSTFYKILISSALGTIWLVIVFLFNPVPMYIVVFLLACFYLLIKINRINS
ncbi:hypothetical protein CRV01_10410 [Arcobacter sp. CECT 8983]|uniref:hypothetical protein n=1 Tax=Arcobacter sp. CECT 8983 TaxID=2044508 RepID=UPI00100A314F|nr:hypothetical protein [Arcobacter sp. CECT 8983]RXJ89023.1 hypothetical protein CRV01_10410 [Arcobacter sp. CECT 8983]